MRIRRKLLIIFFISLCYFAGYGQAKITDTVYYNQKWEICEKPLANFYRCGILAVLNDVWYFTGPVSDYTIGNQLMMTGAYSPDGKRDGEFIFYDNAGRKNLLARYERSMPAGNWTWYYPNGKEKAIIFFPADPQEFQFVSYNDAQGLPELVNGNGSFEWSTNEYSNSYANFIVKGAYVEGRRAGNWTYSPITVNRGEIGYREVYKGGRFVRRIYDNNSFITPKLEKMRSSFFFSPPQLSLAESMAFDDLFSINGDSLTFTNVAYYLVEHKPTEVSLKYKIFDTAFNKVMNIIYRYANRHIYYNQNTEINSKLEFKIGAGGRFENVNFSGQGIDSSAKTFFPFLLSKFTEMEMPGDQNVGMETNITVYIFMIDYRDVLPGSMQNGFTKKLIISLEPREKMEKYLQDNKHAIKENLYDRMLNGNYFYYRRKRN